MSALWRLSFLAIAILGTAFVIAMMEVADADWRSCFAWMSEGTDRSRSYRQPIDAWGTALKALVPPAKEALMLVAAPMVPALAAISLARQRWVAPVALAPMLLVLLTTPLEPSGWHHCDRKGCGACEGIIVVLFLLQLPISTVVLGLSRVWQRLYRTSSA
jgi:hypothetical protein